MFGYANRGPKSTGHDTLIGSPGDDLMFSGDDGGDRLEGRGGNDELLGSPDNNDQLFGGDGDDILSGLGGNDVMDGGSGNNVIIR
jgi:Ca2+-binding RTX toxin-like protein